MTGKTAADLPLGSVVVDDSRNIVWICVPRPGPYFGRWSVSGSHAYVTDWEIDAAMEYVARVLREGY